MLSEHMTPILQRGSAIAIDLYLKFMGLECKLYYPQSEGHYSGGNDDIGYKEFPDEIRKLLIPDLFQLSRSAMSGIMDNLFQNEFKMYVKPDESIPELTKIVFHSPHVGILQYVVQEFDALHTPHGHIYKELTITPYSSMSNNDPIVEATLERLDQEQQDIEDAQNLPERPPIASSETDRSKVKYSYNPVKGAK